MGNDDGKNWNPDDIPFLQPDFPSTDGPSKPGVHKGTTSFPDLMHPEPLVPQMEAIFPLEDVPAPAERPVAEPRSNPLSEVIPTPSAEPMDSDLLSQPLSFGADEIASNRLEEQGAQTASQISVPASTSNEDPALQRKLDLLKPQIESLARLSRTSELDAGQVELLQKYIALKETEARDLRDQQRQYVSFLRRVAEEAETLKRDNRDLVAENEALKHTSNQLTNDLRSIRERQQGELALLKNEFEDKQRRSGKVDAAAQDFYRQRDEWKDRVREELKRIKLKEKELENKHELLRRDMQALLDSKDKHVLELKKKNDALELEMETLEDRLRKATLVLANIEAKKRRLIETMRLASALLEVIDQVEGDEGDGSARRTG